jgi:hypothetical protein
MPPTGLRNDGPFHRRGDCGRHRRQGSHRRRLERRLPIHQPLMPARSDEFPPCSTWSRDTWAMVCLEKKPPSGQPRAIRGGPRETRFRLGHVSDSCCHGPEFYGISYRGCIEQVDTQGRGDRRTTCRHPVSAEETDARSVCYTQSVYHRYTRFCLIPVGLQSHG